MTGKKITGIIAGVGSPVVDQVAQVPNDFLDAVEGEKGGMELVDAETLDVILENLSEPPVLAPGGSAGNTIFALARMGLSTRFLGVTGKDEAGQYYRDSFVRAGGDAGNIKKRKDLPTARCLSLVTPDGERTMRTHLGAAASLNVADISADDFKGCNHVHIEGYLLFDPALITHVLKEVKKAGCSTSVDLASFEVVASAGERLSRLLEKYVDIVFANEEEAETFAGSNDPNLCLERLLDPCDTAVIKYGAKGAVLCDSQDRCSVSAVPVEKVLDTTGAGDFWAAGFLFGMQNGYSLEQCGQCGSLLGAAVIQQEGAIIPESEWNRLISSI